MVHRSVRRSVVRSIQRSPKRLQIRTRCTPIGDGLVRREVALANLGSKIPGAPILGGDFVDALLKEVPFGRAHSAAIS
jgi:hypothetical protein